MPVNRAGVVVENPPDITGVACRDEIRAARQATATPTPVPQATLPAGLMAVPLVRGCNNVVLTYPSGTSIADFHRAIIPASAPAGDVATTTPIVEAIWRQDAATGRFLGWSPVPNAPNDLTTVNRLDAVFICVREPGRLVQPALP